jgi:hypothetical protein
MANGRLTWSGSPLAPAVIPAFRNICLPPAACRLPPAACRLPPAATAGEISPKRYGSGNQLNKIFVE